MAVAVVGFSSFWLQIFGRRAELKVIQRQLEEREHQVRNSWLARARSRVPAKFTRSFFRLLKVPCVSMGIDS